MSILLKPASSGCNLRCTYCFYADEAKIRAVPNYGRMPEAVSHALIEKAIGVAEGSVTFLFQGGEPTLAGLDFFRDFVAHVKKFPSSGVPLTLSLLRDRLSFPGKFPAAEHRYSPYRRNPGFGSYASAGQPPPGQFDIPDGWTIIRI